MKKLCIVLAVVILAMAVVTLCACGGDKVSAQKLSYGEKYGSEYHYRGNNHEDYYIFYKNGTGAYHYRYSDDDEYTVTFNYFFVDDTVVCTFKSVTYGSAHNGREIESDWYEVLVYSENVIIVSQDNLYFTEKYMKAHPEFCGD